VPSPPPCKGHRMGWTCPRNPSVHQATTGVGPLGAHRVQCLCATLHQEGSLHTTAVCSAYATHRGCLAAACCPDWSPSRPGWRQVWCGRATTAGCVVAEGLLAHAAAARCLAAVLPQLLRGSMVRAVCLHMPP
jgi:hypothetical protein